MSIERDLLARLVTAIEAHLTDDTGDIGDLNVTVTDAQALLAQTEPPPAGGSDLTTLRDALSRLTHDGPPLRVTEEFREGCAACEAWAALDRLVALLEARNEQNPGSGTAASSGDGTAVSVAYDSRPDTYEHIGKVRQYLTVAVGNLLDRAAKHDASKLVEPEVEAFDRMTPKLAGLTYGTPEYKQSLAELGVALEHHYAFNSHHPEHYENGIAGMSLLDLLEMVVDWKAASERMRKPMPAAPGRNEAPAYDDDFERSITLNQTRFGYTDELRAVLVNTARELGFTSTSGGSADPPNAPELAELHRVRLCAAVLLAGNGSPGGAAWLRLEEALADFEMARDTREDDEPEPSPNDVCANCDHPRANHNRAYWNPSAPGNVSSCGATVFGSTATPCLCPSFRAVPARVSSEAEPGQAEDGGDRSAVAGSEGAS